MRPIFCHPERSRGTFCLAFLVPCALGLAPLPDFAILVPCGPSAMSADSCASSRSWRLGQVHLLSAARCGAWPEIRCGGQETSETPVSGDPRCVAAVVSELGVQRHRQYPCGLRTTGWRSGTCVA